MASFVDLIHIAVNLRTRYQGKGHGGYCIYEDGKIQILYDTYFPNVDVYLKDANKTHAYSRSGHGHVNVHHPGAWESYVQTLIPLADAAKTEKEAASAAREKCEQERRFAPIDDRHLFEAKP